VRSHNLRFSNCQRESPSQNAAAESRSDNTAVDACAQFEAAKHPRDVVILQLPCSSRELSEIRSLLVARIVTTHARSIIAAQHPPTSRSVEPLFEPLIEILKS